MQRVLRYILKSFQNPKYARWVLHRNIVGYYNEKLGHNHGNKNAALNEPWTFASTQVDKHIRNSWVTDQPEPTIIVKLPKPDNRLHTAYYGQRWIYRLSDVVFDPMWEIVTANNHILIESIRASNFSSRAAAAFLSRKRILRRSQRARKEIEVAVTSLPIGDSEIFGHFLLNALPKILRCQEKSEETITVLLPPGSAPFIKDALVTANILYLEVFTPIRCKNYYLAASSYESTEDIYLSDIEKLRKTYLVNNPNPLLNKYKVYATRLGSARGRIGEYEEKLCRELESIGFIIFRPGERTFLEEVEFFRSASVLIAPTGSGFFNFIWMDPGSLVVEMGSPEIYVATDSEVSTIKMGHVYKYLNISEFHDDNPEKYLKVFQMIKEVVGSFEQ
jgi:hypothetical protein